MRLRLEYRFSSSIENRVSAIHVDVFDQFTIKEIGHSPAHEEISRLGGLMYDAYLDTVDYEGETIEDAVGEIQRTLVDRFYGEIIPEATLMVIDNQTNNVVSAIITSLVTPSNVNEVQPYPMILYVMTAKQYQGRGIGKTLILRVLNALRSRLNGQASEKTHLQSSNVKLSVNNLNTVALKLYESLGFERLPNEN